jgi:hypothetical protein
MSVREAYGNLSVRPQADDQARLSGTRTITYSADKHHIRDLFGAGMRRMRECADHHLAAADGEVRDGDRHASGQDGDYASHAVTSRRWLSPLIQRLSVRGSALYAWRRDAGPGDVHPITRACRLNPRQCSNRNMVS